MTYPKTTEIFQLTINADLPENSPRSIIEIAENDTKGWGCDGADGWEYRGSALSGTQTKPFMLVEIGYQRDMKSAKEMLEKLYGPTPAAQWINAFKAAYPKHDCKGDVGIADASFFTGNLTCFPVIDRFGGIELAPQERSARENSRWLVPAPEKTR